MLNRNSIKISLEENLLNIPSNVIGIDIGQSLSKTAFFDDQGITCSIIDTTGIDEIRQLVSSFGKKIKKINLTGGKAYKLFEDYQNSFETKLINEFKANIEGLELLHSLKYNKVMPDSIIVTIGTGTSIVLKKENFEHIGGSALGGGFLMGFAKFAFNLTVYQDVIELANKGNRYNVDLKVGDIYDKQDNRVDLLFREFTAATLGKINANTLSNSFRKEDILSSINAMLSENIGTIACSFADNYDVPTITFCGGFLIDNKMSKQILSLMSKFKNKKAIILNYSEFAGALGALISK